MLVAVFFAMLSVAAIGYLAVMLLVKRSAVDRTIAELDRAGVDADRKVELGVFARFFNDRGRTKLERKLNQAGWYGMTAKTFLMRTAFAAVTGVALGVVVALWMHKPVVGIIVTIMLGGAGILLPNSLLDGAVTERKKRIRNALPDFLDLVSTTVEAGIALNGAFASAVEGVRGPLRDELLAVLSDIRVGRSRAEALVAMAARVDVTEMTTTVTAIVQAEKLGGDIAGILDQLAHEAREHRMLRAEEMAAQLPVKMTFPMALCMLPALFVMIFGAVLAQLLQHK